MGIAFVIARNTISEAIRRKVLVAFTIIGIAVIALTFSFGQFQARQDLTIVKGMGLGIISLAGLLITVILSINLIPTEIERRTIYTILSKPVRRHEFLLGKYLGALGTLLLNIGIMSIIFVAAFAVKQAIAHPDTMINPLSLFKASLMIYMQLLLLTSVSIFFSVFTTPLVNFFLSFGIFIVGNMSSFTEDLAKNGSNPLLKGFFLAVHYLVPNFGNFNYVNPLVNPEVQVKSEALFLGQNCVYALVYAAILMIIAILAFDRREV